MWLWLIPAAVVLVGSVCASLIARRVVWEGLRVREALASWEDLRALAAEVSDESEAVARRIRELGRR